VSKFDRKPPGAPGDKKKAWRLRGKVKRGETLNEIEQGWISAFEAGETPAAETAAVEAGETPATETAAVEAGEEPATETAAVEAPAPETAAGEAPAPAPEEPRRKARIVDPPPRRKARIVDPPPRFDPPPASGGAKSDWRDRYRQRGDGGGREQACEYFGGLWLGALEQAATALRSIGVDPLIDPQILKGAIVLTLDEVLPAEVALSPRALAVGGSSAILIQRFLRRDEIAKAEKQRADRARADEIRARHASADPTPQPAPPPTAPIDVPIVATGGQPASEPVKVGHGRSIADPTEIARFLGSGG
jgi:hypothetical protein